MSTIEIKREHGEFDLVKFSFRYIQLTENQRNEIENKFKGTKTNIEFNLSKTNGYVAMIDLDISVDPLTIKELNDRLNIDEKKFGIWVSLTTSYDHSGLSFPDYIISFIKTVGGQVDVSTIMITEDA